MFWLYALAPPLDVADRIEVYESTDALHFNSTAVRIDGEGFTALFHDPDPARRSLYFWYGLFTYG